MTEFWRSIYTDYNDPVPAQTHCAVYHWGAPCPGYPSSPAFGAVDFWALQERMMRDTLQKPAPPTPTWWPK